MRMILSRWFLFDFELYVVGDFDDDGGFFDVGDDAVDAAGGDDAVAGFGGLEHGFLLFLGLGLGPEEGEVEERDAGRGT